jgi:hypothetical protein
MDLYVLGVSPSTDVEHRARELQRALYTRLDLAEGLALPVLLHLDVRVTPGEPLDAPRLPEEPLDEPRLPDGRLEAPQLVTGPFAVAGRWLLWTVQGGQRSYLEWMSFWSRFLSTVDRPEGRERLVSRQVGFPLAYSSAPEVLEAAVSLLDREAPRSFQPRSVGLYRVRPLQQSQEPDGIPADSSTTESEVWEQLFRHGLFWEETERRPLRRRPS